MIFILAQASCITRFGREAYIQHVCSQAPFVAVVLFGVYLLATLAHGVSTFKNKPKEAESLQQVWNNGECFSCYL